MAGANRSCDGGTKDREDDEGSETSVAAATAAIPNAIKGAQRLDSLAVRPATTGKGKMSKMQRKGKQGIKKGKGGKATKKTKG